MGPRGKYYLIKLIQNKIESTILPEMMTFVAVFPAQYVSMHMWTSLQQFCTGLCVPHCVAYRQRWQRSGAIK